MPINYANLLADAIQDLEDGYLHENHQLVSAAIQQLKDLHLMMERQQ